MRHRDFGLLVCDPHRATPGLTLFSPLNGKATYIIGLRGDVLHQWEHPLVNGTYAYLLDNGNLLWTGRLPEGPQHMGGRGGLFREYDWSGKVLWEHQPRRPAPRFPPPAERQHDLPRLGGGAAGDREAHSRRARRHQHPDGCMYGDNILEITPEGKTVWEWHACRDMEVEKYPLISNQLRDEFAHANAISPLPNGDIYISFRRLNMIGLIDKQTSKMKWQHRDDSFGMQHDCAPLPNGNITLFANGINTTDQSVLARDRARPAHAQDRVGVSRQAAYTFFSPHISGAQRLAERQHADLRGPVGPAVRGDARGRDRLGICEPLHGAGPRRRSLQRGVPRLPLCRGFAADQEPDSRRAMIAVIFEVWPASGRKEDYLAIAAKLSPNWKRWTASFRSSDFRP